MKRYHVTYYYLATGMEGRADTADYGLVEAASAQEAIKKVMEFHKISDWGLSAREVSKDVASFKW